MRETRIGAISLTNTNSMNHSSSKLPNLLFLDPGYPSSTYDDDFLRDSNASVASPGCFSGESSPYSMSPWNQNVPFTRSPGDSLVMPYSGEVLPGTGLIGSFVREEGHIYSLAASGKLLYTGSDSKNIRVWENQKEWSGFKSKSGLVKAIIISGEKIFTGHQDGKIRVWMISSKNPKCHKRVGTLPRFRDFIKSSIKPSNYVKVRRRRNSLWIKHYDAISCLSLNEEQGLLYSGSWDKTFKVWRIADSKCLESVNAHDDAVNSVVSGSDGVVFTGSADGTVKIWKGTVNGKATKHTLVQTLLKQDCAVTALALNPTGSVLYCGSSDGLVNFWERDRQLRHGGVLQGHTLAVLCLTAAGNLVFSGSADKSICVWRRDNGGVHLCLTVLNGHTGPVKCIAVVEDKETACFDDKRWIVFSGSLDKSVKVWKVSPNSHVPEHVDGFVSQQEHAALVGPERRSSLRRFSSSQVRNR